MTCALAHRRYLGDGVYGGFDGEAIVLSVENGVAAREIVLEPEVWAALAAWVAACGGLNRCRRPQPLYTP
jgi:hypothetical protein